MEGYKVRIRVGRQLQRDFGIGKTKKPYKTRKGAEKRMQGLEKAYKLGKGYKKGTPEAKCSIVRVG